MTSISVPAAGRVSPRAALAALALALVLSALVAAFIIAPPEQTMGDVQRIFYFHVGSAWTAFLSFFVVFASSIAYLRTRNARWDRLALSAAEIGIVFTSVTLLSGSIWAKSAWGTWWTWDPRLTTTLLLWLIYVSYLLLREMLDDPNRQAAFAAVYGIVGFIDVPIVFMSIRWWRSIHPAVVGSEGFNMETTMLPALFLSIAAFTVILANLVLLRLDLEQGKRQVEELKERVRWMQEDGG